MKVLVAIERVIDCNVKVRVKSDYTSVDITNVKMSRNPFANYGREAEQFAAMPELIQIVKSTDLHSQ